MSDTTPREYPRREFLSQVAASAVVLAGAACAGPLTAVQTPATPSPAVPSTPPSPPTPTHWDDSWFTRLAAKHKAVFDSPTIEEGLAVWHVTGYIRGMQEAAGAGVNDVQAVLVFRHQAIPVVFNDAMWKKYEIGRERKVKDFATERWAARNPFASPSSAAVSNPSAASLTTPRPDIEWLTSHGHIILACDLATQGYAGIIARKTKQNERVVYQELKTNLLPGVILQPTGVYAVHRAQEAGCTFIRST